MTEQWICLNESQRQWRISTDKENLTDVTLNLGVCNETQVSGNDITWQVVYTSTVTGDGLPT
jgi:hypothetical protein